VLEVNHAAAAVAREVAARLRHREKIEAATAAARQATFPQTAYWEPHGVAQGDAGLALTCSYLDACFSGEGWGHQEGSGRCTPVYRAPDLLPRCLHETSD
jgi:hypothetical protein